MIFLYISAWFTYVEYEAFPIKNVHFINPKLSIIQNTKWKNTKMENTKMEQRCLDYGASTVVWNVHAITSFVRD